MKEILAFGILFSLYASTVWGLPSDLSIQFLDIGQGDSILIETPEGKHILVDGGPRMNILQTIDPVMSFWNKGFDLMILTHPDLDHVEGLLSVLDRYDVQKVLLTGVNTPSGAYQTFQKKLATAQIPFSFAVADHDFLLEKNLTLDILTPQKNLAGSSVAQSNGSSVIARLKYGTTTLLLTGDANEDEETELLLSGMDVHSDVLKASHHGSRTSNSLNFLKAVAPQFVVFTAGKKNQYDHPSLDTVLRIDELGIPWKSTKDSGTITLTSNGKEWKGF